LGNARRARERSSQQRFFLIETGDPAFVREVLRPFERQSFPSRTSAYHFQRDSKPHPGFLSLRPEYYRVSIWHNLRYFSRVLEATPFWNLLESFLLSARASADGNRLTSKHYRRQKNIISLLPNCFVIEMHLTEYSTTSPATLLVV